MGQVNVADLTSNFAPRWTFYLWCSTSLEWGEKLLTSVLFLGGFCCRRLLCQPSPVDFRLFLPHSPSLAPRLNPSLPHPRICSAVFPLVWCVCVCVCRYPSLYLRTLTLSSLPSQWLQQLVAWVAAAIVDFLLVLLSGNLMKWGGRKREWEREKTEWEVFTISKYFVCF